ncbi:MAG: hypothetical protein CMN55_16400 [Sneathiella sp.]|jgi:hypothetical protein|uniref:hypothetical protein n=1 Tax=Sneathiella sp. TaxID=1964365 RepID=UPI000C379DEE|nr:hypothetical protein [Sneathiella sp.]MAL80659.1 hypothetical protein [Sneathiella sp.]|tara:strand:+ start:5332 stop:5817 length:486 start_codon:yes stop_codon:yes gene_type:complete
MKTPDSTKTPIASTAEIRELTDICEQYRDLVLTYLSFSAAEIADTTSFKAMWKLLNRYGDDRFYIPHEGNRFAKIIHLIGKEHAEALSLKFGGDWFNLSSFKGAVSAVNRMKRDINILELHQAGYSIRQITKVIAATAPTVRASLKRLKCDCPNCRENGAP